MAELKIVCMDDVVSEPVDWLWRPYIPYGAISLIQGDGEMGKTTMSLAIAAAITRGEPLPEVSQSTGIWENHGSGFAVPAPANVIIQNGEDSYAQTIKPRLENLGADFSKIFFVDEEDETLTFSDERIEQIIVEKNAKLILLDPLQAYFGKANMNAAGSVRPVLKQLGAVAQRTGCAVVIVGHLNKRGGKATYRGLGSIDIFATARSVMTVGKTDANRYLRIMVHNKSNLAPAGPPQSYGLDPVTGFYWAGEYSVDVDEVLSGKKRPENQFAKARHFIEDALRHGAVAAADIMQAAEEQGISAKTLQRAKVAMGVYSFKRDGRWFWELPIEGECSEVYEDSQDGQNTRMTALPILTTFPETEVIDGEVG
jgi:hypothetical protein